MTFPRTAEGNGRMRSAGALRPRAVAPSNASNLRPRWHPVHAVAPSGASIFDALALSPRGGRRRPAHPPSTRAGAQSAGSRRPGKSISPHIGAQSARVAPSGASAFDALALSPRGARRPAHPPSTRAGAQSARGRAIQRIRLRRAGAQSAGHAVRAHPPSTRWRSVRAGRRRPAHPSSTRWRSVRIGDEREQLVLGYAVDQHAPSRAGRARWGRSPRARPR